MRNRRYAGEYYTGQYFEYIKSEIEEYDTTEIYYIEDRVIYKNRPYECLEDNVSGEFDSSKWEKKTERESYYKDVPVEITYMKESKALTRGQFINGLTSQNDTTTIRTSSPYLFKQNDLILLQGQEKERKIETVTEDTQTINKRVNRRWKDFEEYIDKVITLV